MLEAAAVQPIVDAMDLIRPMHFGRRLRTVTACVFIFAG